MLTGIEVNWYSSVIMNTSVFNPAAAQMVNGDRLSMLSTEVKPSMFCDWDSVDYSISIHV